MQGLSNNRKIRNATPLEYDGITFKSKLEVMIYKTLKEEGFPVKYEPEKISIWEGFKPTVPFYDKDNVSRLLKLHMTKLLNITYTPDFMFTYNGYQVIVEAKGFVNDVFPIKLKLFRAWLEDHPKSIYFEIHSKKQLLQAVDIIKNLKQENNE